MDSLEQLAQFEYFNEVLIVVGAIFVVIGVLKIVGSSLKLIGWVLLAGVGALGVAIGMERGSIGVPGSFTDDLRALAVPGKEISLQALQGLCERVEQAQ
ncbi:MAG: hypothetical protein K0U93_19895 [Gammaproteobacteria bacterium]|nr:hypothetical protein [Gammaproteobacteria bacterium]